MRMTKGVRPYALCQQPRWFVTEPSGYTTTARGIPARVSAVTRACTDFLLANATSLGTAVLVQLQLLHLAPSQSNPQ